MTVSSPIKNRCFHECFSEWIFGPHWSLHVCPPFMLRCRGPWNSWWNFDYPGNSFPWMSPHSSLQPWTFPKSLNALHLILQRSTFFCLLRTRSSTLFENSATSLPMRKFSDSASFWELALSGCPDDHEASLRSLRIAHLRREECLMMKTNLNTAFQEVLTDFPDRSCAATSLLHSWEDQEWS